jgi:hypothetical protein
MRVRANGSRAAFRLIGGLALALVPLLVAAPALADHCDGSGSIRDNGGEVVGECHEESSGGSESGGSADVWEAHCASTVGPFQDGDSVDFVRQEPLTAGEVEHLALDPSGVYWWWNIVCVRNGTAVAMREIVVEETETAPPEVIRDRVGARIEPPAPVPASSPPLEDPTYVNVPTWLWLDPGYWAPIEETETEGLVTVMVRATPTRATWDMGDGNTVACDGPGLEWQVGLPEEATDCSHTYGSSSYGLSEGTFEASVTVAWNYEWWINGVFQGEFGAVDAASGFEVAVGEIQAVETGG